MFLPTIGFGQVYLLIDYLLQIIADFSPDSIVAWILDSGVMLCQDIAALPNYSLASWSTQIPETTPRWRIQIVRWLSVAGESDSDVPRFNVANKSHDTWSIFVDFSPWENAVSS